MAARTTLIRVTTRVMELGQLATAGDAQALAQLEAMAALLESR
jgi:hypothetical protein